MEIYKKETIIIVSFFIIKTNYLIINRISISTQFYKNIDNKKTIDFT